MNVTKLTMVLFCFVRCSCLSAQEMSCVQEMDSLPVQWNLQTCIDYALQQNITIRKNRLNAESAIIDVKTAKASLYPTLSANVSQRIVNRPNSEINTIIDGDNITSSSSSTTSSSSTVVTYEVVITAPNPDLKLKPRLTANITIYTLDRKGVLCVPSRALRFIPEPPLISETDIVHDCQANHKVWTYEGNIFTAHPVEVGISNGINTEIIGGVTEGTVIVTEASFGAAPEDVSVMEQSGERSPFMPGPPGNDKKKKN